MFSAETQNARGYILSHLQRPEDLMFFLCILILGQHIYTGVRVATGNQISRQEYEPACFHMTEPVEFTSPGAAVSSHSCLTYGKEQVSLPTIGLRWTEMLSVTP